MVLGKTGNCIGRDLGKAHVYQVHPGMKKETNSRHHQPALESEALTRYFHLDIKLKCAHFRRSPEHRLTFHHRLQATLATAKHRLRVPTHIFLYI